MTDRVGAGNPAHERLADILEAVSFAAGRFLGSDHHEEVLDEVLARLGRATDVDRVYLFENHRSPDGELLTSQRREWTATGVESQIGNPELQAIPYVGTGFERWREVLARGEVLSGDVASFTEEERALLEPQGIISLAVVPVHAGDDWWGFMGYDETGGDRSWSPTELQALRTAADTLGTAIRRQRVEAELEASRTELVRMALYDPLTGLPNRTLFEDRLEHALERAERAGHAVAVLFLDLDRFKIVNDTLGHAAGDQLLTTVAERLEERLREEDTLARFGGDEFAGLLEEIDDLRNAEAVVERLATAFEEPFDLFGTTVHVTASLGLVLSSEELVEAEDLLRFSDVAMYRAKEEDGTRYHLFHPSQDEGATVRLHVENEIRRALAEEQFVVRYQPVIELASGRIVGAEALVRWEHPERGLLSPEAFIPIAEESGLIVAVDAFVEEQALRQIARLRAETGRTDLVVSVNLSPRRLREPDLTDRIAAAVEEAGLPAGALELEITETTAIRRMERLAPLRRLGIRVSIDDLGTGYSSLEYLARLDVDTVKIDRSFVSGLGRDRGDTAVVESLLLLARRLELEVVAEGIETEEQLATLRELSCPYGQGYLFSRPVPAGELRALIRDGILPSS